MNGAANEIPGGSGRAGELRGWLAHSVLGNIFLELEADELQDYLREKPELLRGVEEALEELSARLPMDFSPVGLVDALPPLASLDDSAKASLRAGLEEAYQERFQPGTRVALLKRSAEEFLAATGAWQKGGAGGGKVGYEKFRDSTERLLREIQSLPQGVWLPL